MKDKREFFVDYYMIIYPEIEGVNRRKQTLITVPSTDSYPAINGIYAELSVNLDEVPESWYRWDYMKKDWGLVSGKEQKNKVKKKFSIPVFSQ